MTWIDTHAHLYTKDFDEDRAEVVQNAIRNGVETMLLPNIDVASIPRLLDLVEQFPNNCFPMMGLHPGNVKEDWEQQLATMKPYFFSHKMVAVGEIGMDLYWDKTFIEEQKIAFRQQIDWAKDLNLPIVIHAREAFDEIFEILDDVIDERLTGVFHCFTGTFEQAKKVMSYPNFMMGIGGVLTYKKAALDEVLEKVPLDFLIMETDAPFLPPVPYRGKRNESAYLVHTAEKLADIYQIKLTELAEITSRNAKKLFKI
ncbi:MAG: TatD family hydrolase [Crocinitomicaceae bacterium]